MMPPLTLLTAFLRQLGTIIRSARLTGAITILIFSTAVLATLTLISACSPKSTETVSESADKPAAESEAPEDSKLHLPVREIRYQTLTRTLTAPGVVHAAPDHLIDVTSAIAGKLVSVDAEIGQHVKKGQVIARLDDRHIKEQVDQAAASVTTAENNIAQIESNLKFAKENLARQHKLYEAEVAAQKDVVAAENQVENLKAQLETARSQLRTAQAAKQQIDTEFDYTRIATPIDGVVSNRYLNVGNSVDPNAHIVQVVDLNQVVVDASIPADNKISVKPGAHASVTAVADPKTKFNATVTNISPVVDPTSDTFKIVLSCANPEWRLKEGQSVTVTFITEVDRNAILVPRSALVPDPEKPAAYMVYRLEGRKAKRVPVDKGVSEGDLVEIKRGLRIGDKILTREVYGLPDGAEIDVTPEPEASK